MPRFEDVPDYTYDIDLSQPIPTSPAASEWACHLKYAFDTSSETVEILAKFYGDPLHCGMGLPFREAYETAVQEVEDFGRKHPDATHARTQKHLIFIKRKLTRRWKRLDKYAGPASDPSAWAYAWELGFAAAIAVFAPLGTR